MFDLQVKEILRVTGGKLISGDAGKSISGISTDTRKIKDTDLFVALKGPNFDGHNFMAEALAKGAAGAIIQSPIPSPQSTSKNKAIFIKVKDTLKAYGDIAHHYRMKFAIPFIGITGSNGKTTAKEMAYKVLSSKFNVLKNEGTENNLIGLPQTLLRLNAAHSMGILELGTNHFGETKRLAHILKPATGIVTNIGPAHLEFFKSEAGVFKEKMQLLSCLDEAGLALINADDKFLSGIKRLKCKTVRFGIYGDCDFKAAKICQENGALKFTVNDKYDFKINLLGEHNVYNALIAISAGFLNGVSFNDIYKSLSEFHPVDGRLCLKVAGPVNIIDDTYNSNPQSLNAALNFLSKYKTSGRKILVCGDMLELGKAAVKFHAETAKAAAGAGLDYLVSVGNFSQIVKETAILEGMDKNTVFSCMNNTEVLKILKDILKDGDVLLLKGSRLMKLNEVVNALSSFISAQRNMVRV